MGTGATLDSLFSLQDRVALVSGASSGIGQLMANALADAGAAVVLLARRESQLGETAAAIRSRGGRAGVLVADLLERETIPKIVQRAIDLFGDIHIVVNAAGINLREPVDDISIHSWDTTLNLNLSAPFFLTRELVPGMRKAAYGRVINIASLQSTRAFANGLPYGASKAGECQLTRAMAEAWSRDGIMCNAIAPGFFPTELTARVFEDAQVSARFASQTAIGRNGELEDLRGATVFLAAPASNYITGQVLAVDGGFTAR